ncbi:MAG TPA: nucleotidyltransferase domain-containing protein [Chitinivibrionales bacterium]|nr:nucleotidyltransferase domain-containing protein [Chitinivibrionales bacterium]
MIDEKKLLDDFVKEIVAAAHPLRIILFGSWARGERHANSDLDALVVMPDGTACRRTAREIYRNLSGLGYAADIVVATPAIIEQQKNNRSLVYFYAIAEGKELYRAAA